MVSDRFRRAFNAQSTDEVPLVFLTIEHDDLDGLLCFVNNTVAITRNGILFTACAFKFQAPQDDPDQPPQAQIQIDNVKPEDIADLRAIEGEVRCTIDVALASTPDVTEASFGRLVLRNLQGDYQSISGDLSMDNLAEEQYPGDTFNPGNAPGLF